MLPKVPLAKIYSALCRQVQSANKAAVPGGGPVVTLISNSMWMLWCEAHRAFPEHGGKCGNSPFSIFGTRAVVCLERDDLWAVSLPARMVPLVPLFPPGFGGETPDG